MNIQNNSFKSYLKLFQKKLGITDTAAFSLYKYSKEFQDFLKNEAKYDTSLAKLSISDILEQSFYDN